MAPGPAELSRRRLLRAALTLGVTTGVAACASAARRVAPATGRSPRPAATPPVGRPARAVGPAVEVTHGRRDVAAVALTFHGAGDPSLARALLDEAERGGARLTVLAVGTWLAANPTMARRILDGGHDLGNHTYHHLPMRHLAPAEAADEVARCAEVLRRLTGSPGRWFRPSGTPRATPTILAAAGQAGYATSLAYDVDPQDYTDPGADTVTRRTLAAIQRGSVVSLHLGHRGTVDALPAILDGLHTRGLRAVTATGLFT